MINFPIEPVIFQHGDFPELLACERPTDGFAAEIPRRAGFSIYQLQWRCFSSKRGFHEELKRASVNITLKRADGFIVLAKHNKNRRLINCVNNKSLLLQNLYRIGDSFVIDEDACDQRAWLEFVVGIKGHDDAQFLIFFFPVCSFIILADALIGAQHAAIRMFALPHRKRDLIGEDAGQLASFECAVQGLPGHLLPPRPGFVIAHDEVLVVDAREMERELLAVNFGFPHQTGVTERSVSRCNRLASDNIVDDVMISHLAHGVRDGFAVDFDS